MNFKNATETNESEKCSNSPQPVLSVELYGFLNSGFRSDADEDCTLSAYHAAYSGDYVLTFRDNLSVPSLRNSPLRYTMRDFRLPTRRRWELRSSGVHFKNRIIPRRTLTSMITTNVAAVSYALCSLLWCIWSLHFKKGAQKYSIRPLKLQNLYHQY